MTRTAPAPRPGVRPGRKTLASVVGAACAGLLLVGIPAEESGRVVKASIAADGSATIQHVRGRQYLRAYLDIVGVATACDGITTYQGRKIRKGETFTEAQCTEMLEEELVKHAEGVMRCTPGLALSPDRATELRRVGPRFAATSLAYNVGVGRRAIPAKRIRGRGYCGSTVARRFNAGLYPQGCSALLMWNKAGGRVVRGLDQRRRRELAVCTRRFS
jgi:lysozyme